MNDFKKEFINIQLASISNESPYSDRKQALFFIHDFDFNENEFRITEELCSAINSETDKPNYDSLNNAPLVAATDGIDLKGHEPEFDDDGNIIRLNTDGIGTLYNAHIGTHEINGEEKYGLWAFGTLWLRFETTLNVIQKIYDTYGSVDTSVEVLVGDYEISDEGRTAKDGIMYMGHCLLGITKKPAYSDSGMYEFNLEVAEAYKKDIKLHAETNSNEGGNKVNKPIKVEINNGKEIKFHIEANELSFDDIRQKLWDGLNNEKDEDGYTIYKYWIREVFQSHVIISDWDDNKNYKVNYSILNEEITIDFDSIVEVKQVWQIVNNTEINEEIEKLQSEISELKTELENKETKISELNTQIETLQTELSTKDEAIKMSTDEANEKIIKLGEVCEQLKTQIADLEPIKTEYERVQAELAEKELNTKREELKQYALNSKLITEKELNENEEIKNAIFEVNNAKIKEIIADKIVTNAQLELNTNEDVNVFATEPEGLLPTSLKEEMFKPKN